MLLPGSWKEPDWGAEDGLHEAPVTFHPVVTARSLSVNVSYTLLRFDTAAALPAAGNFLASNAWSERVVFVATAASQVVAGVGPISSSGLYFYRCVRTTGSVTGTRSSAPRAGMCQHCHDRRWSGEGGGVLTAHLEVE